MVCTCNVNVRIRFAVIAIVKHVINVCFENVQVVLYYCIVFAVKRVGARFDKRFTSVHRRNKCVLIRNFVIKRRAVEKNVQRLTGRRMNGRTDSRCVDL